RDISLVFNDICGFFFNSQGILFRKKRTQHVRTFYSQASIRPPFNLMHDEVTRPRPLAIIVLGGSTVGPSENITMDSIRCCFSCIELMTIKHIILVLRLLPWSL